MHLVLRNSGEVKAAFGKFDSDHTGELDAEELQQAFAELNLILSLDEVEAFISDRDGDCSGTLDVNEFAQALVIHHIDVSGLARERFKLAFGLASLIAWMTIFVVWFSYHENITALDSFWFAMISLTTVGLGDIVPSSATRIASFVFLFTGLGIMAMIVDALVERGIKAAEQERYEEERRRQKETTRSIQETTVTSEKVKAAYREEINIRRQVEKEVQMQHAFRRKSKANRIRRAQEKNNEMMKNIVREFQESDEDQEEDESQTLSDMAIEEMQVLDPNTGKNTSKLQKWEGFLSKGYKSLTMTLLNNFCSDKTDCIESTIIVDQIYKMFANKLLVNHYAHYLPRRIMSIKLYRYINCLVLQIVLHHLQIKFANGGSQNNFDPNVDNVSKIAAINVVDTADYNVVDGDSSDSVEKKRSIVEYENNEFHFANDSSDSDADIAELHRYASSVADIKMDLH